MITIVVGDTTPYTAQKAKELSLDAKLITESNVEEAAQSGVYYTSLGDFCAISAFRQLLSTADEIIYCEPEVGWTDADKNGVSYMERWTKFCILQSINTKVIKNLKRAPELDTMLHLSDFRKTDNSQLWVAGCSISHGMGVQPNEKYGVILGEQLGLPVSFLTRPGSSIEWAADQILRSDIKENDVVVFGATFFSRFPYFKNNAIRHILSDNVDMFPELIPYLLDFDNLCYKAATKIHQVTNFCKKINAKLIIVGLLVDDKMLPFLVDVPCYYQLYGKLGHDLHNRFLDFGTDNIHPGASTHKWYADQIMQILNDDVR